MSTIPTGGCSPCAADCAGRPTVGMTRDFVDGKRVAPRRRTPVAHRVSATLFGALASAWSGTWRRLVGSRSARTSPKILRVPYRSLGPFLTDPMPPGFGVRASRQSVLQKKQRRTTARTKASRHRHCFALRHRSDRVIDLRGIQSVLRECDRIRVVQQSASTYVVRE